MPRRALLILVIALGLSTCSLWGPRVVVQVLVDESGNVVSAHAVSGHPLLQAAAVSAAYGAQFKPTVLSGVPVKVTGVITYNFVAK